MDFQAGRSMFDSRRWHVLTYDLQIPSYTPSKMLYKPSSIPRCKALSFTSLNYSARMNTEGLFEAKQKTNSSGEWVEMGNGEAQNNG